MGDFDKIQAEAPSGDKRKQVFVGVLGVILLAIVGFHFLKGSPEQAVAGPNPVAADPGNLAVKETPKSAIAKLDNDPTASYPLGAALMDSQLAAPPHDPFRLPDRFRKPEVVTQPIAISHDPITPINKAAPSIAASNVKVDGIFRIGKNLQAIVNGSIVSSGASVGDAFIVDIQEDRVVVRNKDFLDGPTTTVMIQSKLK